MFDLKACRISGESSDRDPLFISEYLPNQGGENNMIMQGHLYYQKASGCKPDDSPNIMRIVRQTVSLLISAKLADEDFADVVIDVRFFKK